MLGRLRMTVNDALRQYKEFGNEIFGKARWWNERSLFWFPRAKYSSTKTRTIFPQIISEKMIRDGLKISEYYMSIEPFMYDEDRTRTYVSPISIKTSLSVSINSLQRTSVNLNFQYCIFLLYE